MRVFFCRKTKPRRSGKPSGLLVMECRRFHT
nr:MAG TPA: hypothetical protein [Caudoviricetes sp.]